MANIHHDTDVNGETGQTQPVSSVARSYAIFTQAWDQRKAEPTGKIGPGQNGFRLSLLGFEPEEDYKRLVVRITQPPWSRGSPDRQLLLQNTVNASPHGRGGPHQYRLPRISACCDAGFSQRDAVLNSGRDYQRHFDFERIPSPQTNAVARRPTTGGQSPTYSDRIMEGRHTARFTNPTTLPMAEVSAHGLGQTGEWSRRCRDGSVSGPMTVFRAGNPNSTSIRLYEFCASQAT